MKCICTSWNVWPVTWDLRSAAGTVSGTTGNVAEAGRELHTMITAASTEKEKEEQRDIEI